VTCFESVLTSDYRDCIDPSKHRLCCDIWRVTDPPSYSMNIMVQAYADVMISMWRHRKLSYANVSKLSITIDRLLTRTTIFVIFYGRHVYQYSACGIQLLSSQGFVQRIITFVVCVYKFACNLTMAN